MAIYRVGQLRKNTNRAFKLMCDSATLFGIS